MKKNVLVICSLFVVLVFTFTGCGKATSAPNYKQEESSVTPQRQNITMLTNSWGAQEYCVSENGCYYLERNAENVYTIVYYDFSSNTSTLLCAAPSCSHSDETCSARIEPANCGASIFTDNNNLFLAVFYATDDSNTLQAPQIFKMDMNGQNREVLYTLNAGETLFNNFATDDTALYFSVAKTESYQNGIYSQTLTHKINLDDKKSQIIQESTESATFLGGIKDKLLYQAVEIPEIQNVADLKKIKNTLFSIQMQTNTKEELYTWENSQAQIFATDNHIYIYNAEHGVFEELDVVTKSTKTISEVVPWNPSDFSCVFQYGDENILVFDIVPQQGISRRFFLTMATHTISESMLRYQEGESEHFFKVLGFTPNGYLVQNGSILLESEMIVNGTVEMITIPTPQLGIISEDDYAENNPTVVKFT